jgi:hypothetical protein
MILDAALDQINGSERLHERCLTETNTEHESEVDNGDTANANSQALLSVQSHRLRINERESTGVKGLEWFDL